MWASTFGGRLPAATSVALKHAPAQLPKLPPSQRAPVPRRRMLVPGPRLPPPPKVEVEVEIEEVEAPQQDLSTVNHERSQRRSVMCDHHDHPR